MKKEIFALVDCNNFYVSCERIFRPDLLNKPVGILSNNDGCVVALSNEMKRIGVNRGTPEFKIRDKIKKHNITLLSSNYALYGDISARVMKTLSHFSPDIEIYSIDEAFLKLTSFNYMDLTAYGHKIKNTIKKWIGIPVSVGIGPSKTLAKISVYLAKKYKKFDNVFNITNHPKFNDILKTIPVKEIWGIGRQYSKKLREYGIENTYQLIRKPDDWIRKNFTVVGLRTVKELKGRSCLDIETDIVPNKEIVSSKSFGKKVSERKDIEEAAADYCIRAVQKLRRQNLLASLIMVYLTTNRFRDEPQYANYETSTLPVPSAYTPDFLFHTKKIIDKIYRSGYNYKKVGVMISDIITQNNAPIDFINPCYLDDKRKAVIDKVDEINKKWGDRTITYTSSGIKKDWRMRRERLTPRYTTCWDDIPTVK